MIGIDSDYNIEVLLLTGLDQQRDDVDHNCSGSRSTFQLGGACPYGWVHDLLEILACQRITEDDLGKPRPIELSVAYYQRAEAVNDRGKPRGTGLDNFSRQYIGVDDDRTALCQLGGDEALSRPDATGQTDPHHAKRAGGQLPPVSF